jgi:NAD-dependent histone deacetylase SIR2
MPRSTQHLDLSDTADLSYAQQQAQIDLLVQTLRTRRKIVVIAGAGISTSAGSKCLLDDLYNFHAS